MNLIDILRIQAALGVTLPAPYRAFLLAYPAILRETQDAVGQSLSERHLLADADAVIALNRELGLPGDRGLLAVGDDGCGNWVAVGLDGVDALWSFDHEVGGVTSNGRTLETEVWWQVANALTFSSDEAAEEGRWPEAEEHACRAVDAWRAYGHAGLLRLAEQALSELRRRD